MKKKEQFNLALWDRLKKDNIPHEFETREGNKVNQVTMFIGDMAYSVAGVSNETIRTWRINGLYSSKESESDLFITWEEEQLMLEGVLYIYPDNSAHFVKKPLTNPSEHIIAIKTVAIPYTKGEGLGDGK